MRIGTTETFMQFGITHYREIPDADDPAINKHEKELRRIAMTSAALAALPPARRSAAGIVMKLARARRQALARNRISQSKESR